MEKPPQFELAQHHSEFKQVREQDAITINKDVIAFYAMMQEREPRTREYSMNFAYAEDGENKGRGTLDGGWFYETEKGVQACVVLSRDSWNYGVATFFYDAAHDLERSRVITDEELPQLKEEIAKWFDEITQHVLPRDPHRPYDVEIMDYTTEVFGATKRNGHCFILKIQDIPVATVMTQGNEKGYAVDFFRKDPDVLRPLETYWRDEKSD